MKHAKGSADGGADRDSPPSRMLRNLRLSTWEGLMAFPIVHITMPGNVFLAALLSGYFGLNEGLYGLISSIPFWMTALQVLITPLLAHKFKRMSILKGALQLQALGWLMFALLIPLLGDMEPVVITRMLAVFIALSSLGGAVAGTVWQAWISDWVPDRVRGRYFGVRNRAISIVSVLFLLVGGELLERLDGSALGFQVLFILAVGLRLAGLRLLSMIDTGTRPEIAPAGFAHSFGILRKSKAYWQLIVFGVTAHFMLSSIGSFVSVMMLEQVHLNIRQVSGLVILATLAGALGMPVLGRVTDRIGNLHTLIICLLCWQAMDILWGIVGPGPTRWLLPLMWVIGGFFGSGFILCYFNLQLKIIPTQAKVLALSVHMAIISLAAGLGPICSGLLLETLANKGFNPLHTYQAVFASKAILMLFTPLLLRGMREPRHSNNVSLIGGMRVIRLALGAQIAQVGEWIFFRNSRKH